MSDVFLLPATNTVKTIQTLGQVKMFTLLSGLSYARIPDIMLYICSKYTWEYAPSCLINLQELGAGDE